MTLKHALIFLAYAVLFLTSAFGMIWWQRRRRKLRKPFGDDLRLLRGPGESQLKLHLQGEENDLVWAMGYALLPVVVALIGLQLAAMLPDVLKLGALALTGFAFVAVFYFSARLYARRAAGSFNRYLGYFGERIVAEYLEPLKGQGWRILHDVPFQNNGTKFNLDHIAIGPQGVFAIETKTRRKGNARPGFDDHRVFFDGRDLEWPWGNDNHGLEQAERNATLLSQTIKDETGERMHVTPILALPGWFVEPRPSRESRLCRVLNPKALPKFLPVASPTLDAARIAGIANKLEARCRDVEY
jgi:hypothetical protein